MPAVTLSPNEYNLKTVFMWALYLFVHQLVLAFI